MEKDFKFPEPVERQDVRQRVVGSTSCPQRAWSNKYARNLWSYRLKEETGYAYYGEYPIDKIPYYTVLSIDDEELLKMLDYWDRNEVKADRTVIDNSSYAQLNYMKKLDEDGEALDPMDHQIYIDWVCQENSTRGKKIPLKAELGIIKNIMRSLSPADQRVFQYMFRENQTDAEIKEAFELKHSAWANEKRRFLDKVRKVFVEFGFDVPTQEELRQEARRRADIMRKIKSAKDESEIIDRLGESISKELKRIESDTRSRAFAAEEQQQEDIRNAVSLEEEEEEEDDL